MSLLENFTTRNTTPGLQKRVSVFWRSPDYDVEELGIRDKDEEYLKQILLTTNFSILAYQITHHENQSGSRESKSNEQIRSQQSDIPGKNEK